MALEQQTIALIGVGVVIIGVTVGLHSITQADIRALGTSVDGLRGDIASVGQRVAALEPRVDGLDQRLVRIDERLGNVEARLITVETRLGRVEDQVVGIDGRLGRVETDLNTILALGQGVEPSSYVLDVPSADEDPNTAQETEEPATADIAVSYAVAEVVAIADPVEAAEVAAMTGPVAVAIASPVAVASQIPWMSQSQSRADDVVLAGPTAYRIVKENDSSFGNVRRRVTLELEIDGADPTSPTTIETLMRAATDRHQVDSPDAVSVRLWRSYGNGSNAQNRIVYAPDGCGWSGGDCTGEVWTELLKGDMPHG